MQHCIMIKLILILLASNKALGDSCPVLNLKYKGNFNFMEKMLVVYQYQEVDPVVLSPFYGIGDEFSKIFLEKEFLKVCCSIDAEKIPNSSFETTDIILNRIRFFQNLKDNKIQLSYSEKYKEIFCGAVAIMTKIWLIDHSPCSFSLYGCQMAEVNGKLERFEGVLILRARTSLFETGCSNLYLQYTYDVLQKQTGIAICTLKNGTVENITSARNNCQIEKAQYDICKKIKRDNIRKAANLIYFMISSIGLTTFLVGLLYEKLVGRDILM